MRWHQKACIPGAVVSAALLVAVAGAPTAGAVPARAAQLVPTAPGVTPLGGATVHAHAWADDGVLAYGKAPFLGSPTSTALSSPIVGMAATSDGAGYWLDGADGGVLTYGDAGYYGSAGAVDLNAPVVGMAATPDSRGYWEVALDGGIFTYGDAGFFGSTGDVKLNQPIVAMASTPDGKGYWLVAADGGVFTFGDADYFGSTGSLTLNSPIVGMAPTADGKGYWLVAADGGIFTFGDAHFYGSTGGQPLVDSVVGMVAAPGGTGYVLAGGGGAVYAFGSTGNLGDDSGASPSQPVSDIVGLPGGGGYWLLEPDAFPTAFSHPGGGGAIVAAAASQVGADPESTEGQFCNPYGPCEPWCALFATWAWESAGVPIPRYPFVGSIYDWAADTTVVTTAAQPTQPGDVILYGTGPSSVSTAVHTGVIAQVWPDGAVITIEGDAGPGPYGYHDVVMNGPFLPTDSADYNGFPVFGVAHP